MWRLCWTLVLFAAAALGQSSDEQAIRQVLADQTAAWNRGDLEAFMVGYEDSPETAFVGAGGVRKGYQAVLERYRRDYPDRERMGETSFHDIDVRLLGDDFATVIGRFKLARPRGGGRSARRRLHAGLPQGPGRLEDRPRPHHAYRRAIAFESDIY